MTGKRFELNWPYIAFAIITSAAVLSFIGWMVTAQVLMIAIDLASVMCFFALLWNIYCDYKTEFTEDAITRPSLLRLRGIKWSDITEVKVFNGVGYHIHSQDERIIVSPYVYKRPDLVVAELMNSWGAAKQAKTATPLNGNV
jgi:Mn2+/Fe2+ NRAMP family transporter